MAEKSTEERFAQLEARVAGLEHQRRIQEDRDIALLARVDGFIDDLRRIERVQMRGFEELKSEQQEMKADLQQVKTDLQEVKTEQKKAFEAVADTLRDHKVAIEAIGMRMNTMEDGQRALQTGQEQILAILTGKAKTND